MSAKPTFEFGLVMAGAISAGAYTAGVVDFLIEALDAWEEARRLPDYRGPQHRALLKVMSGASAGGMTSAIAGVALQSVVQPVRNVDAPPPAGYNRLYDAWVRRIDVSYLLQTGDLTVEGLSDDEARSLWSCIAGGQRRRGEHGEGRERRERESHHCAHVIVDIMLWAQ